jgi:hypothetical protein
MSITSNNVQIAGFAGLGASFCLMGGGLVCGVITGDVDHTTGNILMSKNHWKSIVVGSGGVIASMGLLIIGLAFGSTSAK